MKFTKKNDEAKAALLEYLGGTQVTIGFDGGTINANGKQGIIAVCVTSDKRDVLPFS